MNQADISILYDYNYWANARILLAAARINEEQFVASTPFPRGSLRGTLLHILDAEYGWRELLMHAREVDDLNPADLPTLAAIQVRWHEEEAAMRAYLAGLEDEQMDSIIRYTNYQGMKRERVLWQCLFHVINHGTQHRSEAAAMLTDLGQSPGDLDFSLFVVQMSQKAG